MKSSEYVSRDLQLVRGELKPHGKRDGRHYTTYEKIELLEAAWTSPLYPVYKEARKRGDLEAAKIVIQDEPEYLREFYAHAYNYDVQIFDRLKKNCGTELK